MIREDGKIVIQRKLNYRLKTIILRDYEIQEIYDYYANKLKAEKRKQYELLLIEMLELEYSKQFVEMLKIDEKEKIEEMLDNCMENQDSIDNIGIGYVWDLTDCSYRDFFDKKYEKFRLKVDE